ncbi:RluA family pseudouridine synthase [Polluticaenibacter yanchengensis]|uniref:RluA family pseudouridine synthase n=1 Tax=Polluticaenibacter yanchengensis TaxID=3014562 RepID=A0ABT4UMB3_9BACT|nr:RluA family pseudouridine synthase [Chitinophagaceae bacterium LY-5]
MQSNHYIHYYQQEDLKGISLPGKFTFPFYYTPHPLSLLAAKALQDHLTKAENLDHNFGLNDSKTGMKIGKMFGILVIKDKNEQLGYLWAFSGKLANSNEHPHFVPPVFDMLTEESFYLAQNEIVNNINHKIALLENAVEYQALKQEQAAYTQQSELEISKLRLLLTANKAARKLLREENKKLLSGNDYALLESDLVKQSLGDKHRLNTLINDWKQKLGDIATQIDKYDNDIKCLKQERKEKSNCLQQQLFQQYAFLNKYGDSKSLKTIFSSTSVGTPPAGAGECATPKLLQYAFLNGLSPVAMAEFWWGASPKSEIRKHGQYYPACTGKCEPILKHMLLDIETDENPLLINNGADKQLEIVFEDDQLIIVNKPHDLLSVPGIHIQDSVYSRLKTYLGNIEPLIIHRLDMQTSGLLLVAKTKNAHQYIQKQFLKRSIQKRYTAVLNGSLKEKKGEILLPLKENFEDRPRQMVCFQSGKAAHTKWQLVAIKNGRPVVHFWPLTGRTHQLRIHAAHMDGLNAPIIGDDLYGTSSDRLYLHAAYISFRHPVTKEMVAFEVPDHFNIK